MRSKPEQSVLLFPLILMAAAVGCDPAMETGAGAASTEGAPTEVVENGIFDSGESGFGGPTLLKRYLDCKGRVESAMWFCLSNSNAEVHTVTCPVGDMSYVAVGGGAMVNNGSSFPGAFIIDQFVKNPNGARDGFRASSKSHIQSQPHRLFVYVIGLRITGVSRDQMLSNLQETSSSTVGQSGAPETWFQVPSGRILLGGSVFLNWFQGVSPGQLLVGSWLSSSDGFVGAKTAQLGMPDGLSINASATSIASSINGINLQGKELWTSTSVGSGVATASVTVPRMALTGIGAWADFNGEGRFQFNVGPDLFGDLGKVKAQTKDHLHANGGTTWVNAVGLQETITGPTRCVAPVP